MSLCKPRGIGRPYLRGLLRWKPTSELCPAPFSPLDDAGRMLAAGCPLSPQPSCLSLLAPSVAPNTLKVREGSGKSRGRGLIYNLSVMVPRAPCGASTQQHGLYSARAALGGHKPQLPPSFPGDTQAGALRHVVLQVVYDEGPLYVFSPTEELRKRWIHQLKSGEFGDSVAPSESKHKQLAVHVSRPRTLGFRGLAILWLCYPTSTEERVLIRNFSHDKRIHKAVPRHACSLTSLS